MNDLQILLISAGVVLILIVLLYNGWQDWRARRSMRQTLDDERHDVLMQNEPEQRREPAIFNKLGSNADENVEIDAICEAVIDINLAQPISGSDLIEPFAAIVSVGKKPVRPMATSTDGYHHINVQADTEYSSIQLAILLANRNGPLTNIEWSHLWTLAQNLADRFDGMIDSPEQDEVIKKANELDTLCAEMDAQVGLIVQLKQASPIKQLEKSIAESGFTQKSGNWVWLAENNAPRFLLQIERQPDDMVHRVDLVLDVPNSMPDNQAFSRMVAVGRDLAQHLDAHLLDDQGRTFQDSSAAAIDQQLNDLYDKLDSSGFLAGTPRAARVFS